MSLLCSGFSLRSVNFFTYFSAIFGGFSRPSPIFTLVSVAKVPGDLLVGLVSVVYSFFFTGSFVLDTVAGLTPGSVVYAIGCGLHSGLTTSAALVVASRSSSAVGSLRAVSSVRYTLGTWFPNGSVALCSWFPYLG